MDWYNHFLGFARISTTDEVRIDQKDGICYFAEGEYRHNPSHTTADISSSHQSMLHSELECFIEQEKDACHQAMPWEYWLIRTFNKLIAV